MCIPVDARSGALAVHEVACSDEDSESMRSKILSDLKTDAPAGPRNQGNWLVRHSQSPFDRVGGYWPEFLRARRTVSLGV
jgi:hypothetical protein